MKDLINRNGEAEELARIKENKELNEHLDFYISQLKEVVGEIATKN